MEQIKKVHDQMIRTWITDVSVLYKDDLYEQYYRTVPEFRQRKADRIKVKEDKALSIGAWVLYQEALKQCKEAKDSIFNLSHSGKYALCTVVCGEKDVKAGCDIEEIKKFHEKIVQKYFCNSEKEYILSKETDEQRREVFYRYWVLKESFAKATRYGMKIGIDSYEIRCTEEEAILINQPDYIKEKYYFREYKMDIPYKIAVCATSNNFAENIEIIDLKDKKEER